MLAITNAALVMRDHYIRDGVILIEGGAITALGEARALTIPAGSRVYDAKGYYAGPGLIDIHTHSSAGKYFYDEPLTAAKFNLSHGVTGLLCALYFNMTLDELLCGTDTITRAMQAPGGENILGIYMEAPYMNPKFGADRTHNPWAGAINPAEYTRLIERAQRVARVWAVAPEREGIYEFCKDVKAQIPAAVFSVAHSEATPTQIERLIPLGLKLGTHHTNATGTIQKYPECRGVCVDEAVNYRDDIYAELICDARGIHVDPYMLRLVRKIKGDDKIILISDACDCDGPVPPGYEGVTDINFDHEGEIYGSKLTLDIACLNMMTHTGASLADVFKFASLNPARLLGLTDRGELAPGKRADIVICDHMMNIQNVFLKGEIVK